MKVLAFLILFGLSGANLFFLTQSVPTDTRAAVTDAAKAQIGLALNIGRTLAHQINRQCGRPNV